MEYFLKRTAWLFAASAALFIAAHADARVFVVTTTEDGTNEITLRGAIMAATAVGGNNTIFLPSGHYGLEGGSGGLAVISGSLAIIGQPGAIVDASGLVGRGDLDDYVFNILRGATVRLENLVLTGGAGYGGGGIANDGSLELDNCKIEGNSSDAFGGGGIYNSGNLVMSGCSVTDNTGGLDGGFSADGGGIYNAGDLTMEACTVRGNDTIMGLDGDIFLGGFIVMSVGPFPGFPGEDAGDGGGIYNTGTLSVNNCSIENNTCGRGGGGSTSYDDPAGDGGNGGNGGGIYNAGRLSVSRSTIENNHCGNGGSGGNGDFDPSYHGGSGGSGGNGGSGGGIFNASGASAMVTQSVVNSNSVGSGGAAGSYGNPGFNGSGPNLSGNLAGIKGILIPGL